MNNSQAAFTGAFAFIMLLCLFMVSTLIRRSRMRAREARVRLEGDEVSQVSDYGSIARTGDGDRWSLRNEHATVEHAFTAMPYYPGPPRWLV
jgi:hypothetical protein